MAFEVLAPVIGRVNTHIYQISKTGSLRTLILPENSDQIWKLLKSQGAIQHSITTKHCFQRHMIWRRKSEDFQRQTGQSGDCFIIPEWANLSHEKKKNVVPFSTEALQYGHKAHDKHDSSGSEKEKKLWK